MSLVALSELLGATVRDASGSVRGRVREIAIAPQDHPTRIAFLIVNTTDGERVLPSSALKSCGATVRTADNASGWDRYTASDGVLLLKRDLLDQQIIDVHGRKVVRVNDVELDSTPVNSHVILSVLAVDVGARGAIRRLTQGLVPAFTMRALLGKIPPRVIPWQYVDLLETDPARRVKLKIVYEGLSKMHPADIANIVEDLAPAERESVFETIDEEVAAEALEEMDPKVQVSIVDAQGQDAGGTTGVVFSNEGKQHKTMLALLINQKPWEFGQTYTYSITVSGPGTIADANDFFSLTILY